MQTNLERYDKIVDFVLRQKIVKNISQAVVFATVNEAGMALLPEKNNKTNVNKHT